MLQIYLPSSWHTAFIQQLVFGIFFARATDSHLICWHSPGPIIWLWATRSKYQASYHLQLAYAPCLWGTSLFHWLSSWNKNCWSFALKRPWVSSSMCKLCVLQRKSLSSWQSDCVRYTSLSEVNTSYISHNYDYRAFTWIIESFAQPNHITQISENHWDHARVENQHARLVTHVLWTSCCRTKIGEKISVDQKRCTSWAGSVSSLKYLVVLRRCPIWVYFWGNQWNETV